MNKLRNRILKDRELRHVRLLELAGAFAKPVVCGRINYPGANKLTYEAQQAFKTLVMELYKAFLKRIEYSEIRSGFDGDVLILVVDKDLYDLKNETMRIEEKHPLGRLFDIDVMDLDGALISRQDLKADGRKCIVCGESVLECMITQKHELAEVIQVIHNCIESCNSEDVF